MSNKELVKQFYVAFKNKDECTYLKLCDDDIEWITSEGMPNGGIYTGKKEIFENYFPNMLANFKEFHAIPDQILDLGNHIMVNGKYKGVTKYDKKLDVSFSHVFLIKENKIKQFRQFTDTQKIQDVLKIS